MRNLHQIATGIVIAFVTSGAVAERINIDLNDRWGGPSSSFGAAAGQVGHWNSFDPFTQFDPPRILNDLSGSPTDVTVRFPLTPGVGSGNVTAPVIPPDPSALLDDFMIVTDIPERVRLDNLDAGMYDVYVYAASIPERTTFIVRWDGNSQNAAADGGWNGSFEQGLNYQKFSLSLTGNRIDIDFVTGGMLRFGLLSGVQIVQLPDGDFDNDGDYACADVDTLVAQIVSGANNVLYDMTGDGLVNTADLTKWLAEAGAAEIPSGNPYLVGDADLDGSVDGSDFIVWNMNKFTNTAAWCSGDFNADGSVDGSDFIAWNMNKFTSADGMSAVPEPTCIVLGCLWGLVACRRIWRGGSSGLLVSRWR